MTDFPRHPFSPEPVSPEFPRRDRAEHEAPTFGSPASRDARRINDSDDDDEEEDDDLGHGTSTRGHSGSTRGKNRTSGGRPGQRDDEAAAGATYTEEPIKFEQIPKAARQAVLDQCPGAGRFDAVKLTDGEAVCYNVLGRRGRVEMSVTVSAAGEVMEYEVDIAPSRLPKAVRETLEREYDGVSFDRAGAVTMHLFELQFTDEDGVPRILQIDAAGKVLAEIEDEGTYGDDISLPEA